jgi:hypothetical protein
MRLIGRLLVIGLALICAIAAATFFLMIAAITDPSVGRTAAAFAWASFATLFDLLERTDDPREAFLILSGVWTAATSLLVGPPVLAAFIGEIARIRSFVWYAGASGFLTALLPWALRGAPQAPAPGELRVTLALFLTGTASGLVYWLIAGRGAGRKPEPIAARPANDPASPAP